MDEIPQSVANSKPAGKILGYAHARTRRRWIGLTVLGMCLTVVAWSGMKWGPANLKKARTLYWQRQCLNYSAPPEQIVFEEDPAEAGIVINSGGFASGAAANAILMAGRLRTKDGLVGALDVSNANVAIYEPRCLTAFVESIGGFRAPPVPSPGRGPHATAFLGRLTTPGGREYLAIAECILVRAAYNGATAPYELHLCLLLLEPATLEQPASWVGNMWELTVADPGDLPASNPSEVPRLRVYSGQVDPTDSSRFTVRYQLGSRQATTAVRISDQLNGTPSVTCSRVTTRSTE